MKKEQYSSVFERSVCINIGWALKVLGAVILATNLLLDIAYFFKQTFANSEIYAVYCVLMAIRFAMPLLNVLRYCVCKLNEPGVKLAEPKSEDVAPEKKKK